jgi:hypothetical protein
VQDFVGRARYPSMTPVPLINWRFVAIDANPELVRLRGDAIGHPRYGSALNLTSAPVVGIEDGGHIVRTASGTVLQVGGPATITCIDCTERPALNVPAPGMPFSVEVEQQPRDRRIRLQVPTVRP